ncbi:hypothetical protein ACXZ1K_18690 [Pedobacter sp. PWIIR3]
MKIRSTKVIITLGLLMGFAVNLQAQTGKMFRAAIIQYATAETVQDALVKNLNNRQTKKSDNFGVFSIFAAIGDSLLIRKIGYQDRYYKVTGYNDERIFIKLSNELLEVKITGQKKASENFKEESRAYSKEKGIFYEGKPPIALLSPFGGSPVTFFYELFSKDGKRVRRLNQLAAKAAIDEEIARRFNQLTIKRVVDISDLDMDAYRDNYPPKVEELRTWSDFQLFEYIKTSFLKFKKKEKK